MNLHFNLRAPKNNYMDRYTCTFPSLADGMAMAFSCREWALQRRDICTVDSSNLYSFKGIKLLEHATFDDEHQSTRGFPYPDGNVVHIGIGESARWLALMIKSCTFRKFCFLRFRSIFFFWCAVALNFEFAFRRVPRCPRLWPFACAFETPCLTIVESFRAVGCYCDHFFFPSIFDRRTYSISYLGNS